MRPPNNARRDRGVKRWQRGSQYRRFLCWHVPITILDTFALDRTGQTPHERIPLTIPAARLHWRHWHVSGMGLACARQRDARHDHIPVAGTATGKTAQRQVACRLHA